jgi:protein arginine kinase activator
MLCDKCKGRPATVHVVRTENGIRSEQHLCEVCAAEMGHFNFGEELNLHQFFPGFFSDNIPDTISRRNMAERCPHCGMTYKELVEGGKLGCDKCYEIFSQQLQPLLLKLHAADHNRGKYPLSHRDQSQAEKDKDNTLQLLRQELLELVKAEKFEEAAIIRDKIKILEEEGDA